MYEAQNIHCKIITLILFLHNYHFIDCVNGRVRLVGGSASNEGTIEICANSLWGLISDAGWDQNDAQVVCKQLNLPYDGMYGIISNYSDS